MEFKLGPHDSLVEISTDWDFENDGDAVQLEHNMIEFMVANGGIGLAANQIDIKKRVFVIGSNKIEGFPEPFAVFNPVITEASKETELDQEGCLSYPGLWLPVARPKRITVVYQNSKGDTIEAEIDGLISRCFQHELDHLNGVCFVDRVSPLKLQFAMKKLRKKSK
jgi:peptide deformylase